LWIQPSGSIKQENMFSSAFEQEERSFANQKRLKSFLATISFAALLLLAFYLIKLTIPNPPFPELASGGGRNKLWV
jgi:hypothetical protein